MNLFTQNERDSYATLKRSHLSLATYVNKTVMPTFHISGGGDALQTALNQIVANQTNTFIIQDGTYDSILFSSSTISAASSITNANTKIVLSSENGPNNCIIDGGTKWENDIFDSTLLSAGKSCLSADNTFYNNIPLTCYGITFRNGYCGQGQASGIFFTGQNYKGLSKCVFERCCGTVTSSTGFCSVMYNCSNVNDCIIRHCVGNRGAVCGAGTYFTRCLIENIKTLYSTSIFEGARIYRCVVRNINNGTGILTNYSQDVKQNLFYNISGNGRRFFSLCRGNFYGNTIVLPKSTTNSTEILTWNTKNKLYIANNIFSAGAIRAILSSPEIIVVNNYGGRFFGEASKLSGNITGNADPGFVDAATNDYHLLSTSPCISSGSSEWLSAYTAKYDFDRRPFEDPPSVGAYQYYYYSDEILPNKTYPLGTI